MTTPYEPLSPDSYATLRGSGRPPSEAGGVDPDDPPWSLMSAVLVWIVSVLLLLLMPVFFVIPYAQYRGLNLDAQALGEFVRSDKTAILVQIIAYLPAHLLTLGLSWALVTQFGKFPFWRTLGWTWGKNFGFWKSLGAALVLLVAGLWLAATLGGQETGLDKIISSSRAAGLMTALLATATAPLVEEIIYRGLLYAALQRAIGTVWAVVGVLALFTLVHVPQYLPNLGVLSAIGVLSVFLTLIRAYTGRLLPCFVIHLVFNGLQSVAIVSEPYLKQFYPGGGAKTGLIAHAVHLLAS